MYTSCSFTPLGLPMRPNTVKEHSLYFPFPDSLFLHLCLLISVSLTVSIAPPLSLGLCQAQPPCVSVCPWPPCLPLSLRLSDCPFSLSLSLSFLSLSPFPSISVSLSLSMPRQDHTGRAASHSPRPSPTWDTPAPVGCLSGPPLLTNAHACAFSDDDARWEVRHARRERRISQTTEGTQ